MLPLLERQDAVISQTRRTAPHHHVGMLERDAARTIGAAVTAEQEHRGQPEGH